MEIIAESRKALSSSHKIGSSSTFSSLYPNVGALVKLAESSE
jgi:hypothetical protein